MLIEGNTISNTTLAKILQRAKIRAQELKAQMTHWNEEWNKNCNGPAVCIEISSPKAMGHDFYKLLDEFLDMDKPIDKVEAGAAFYPPKPRPLKEI